MKISLISRKWNAPYHSLISQVALLGVVISGFVFGVIPAGKTIWTMQRESQLIALEIDALTQKANVLGSLDEESLKQSLRELFAAIPTEKSVPTLLSTLEGVSNQAGVSLLDVTISGTGGISSDSAKPQLTNATGAQVLRFSVSTEGTLAQMQQFFQTVVHVRRLFGLRSIDMSVNSTGIVTAKLELETYSAPLPRELGSATSRVEALSPKEEATISRVSAFTNMANVTLLPPPLLGPVKADPFSL